MEVARKMFYKNYNKHDEYHRIDNSHRKVPTIYYAPIFFNLLAIHLISAIYYNHKIKYLNSGSQQRFIPDPDACLYYQPHKEFSAYLSDSVRIYIIAEILEPIGSVIL